MRKTMLMKRIVAFVCAGIMACGILTACGGSGQEGGKDGKNDGSSVDNSVEDTTTLHIMFKVAGYGSEWITELAKAFEAKHEGVTVKVNYIKANEAIQADIENYKNSDTDLYFAIPSGGIQSMMAKYKTTYEGGQAIRDLTYLYDSQIPGEDLTLGEKMNASIKKSLVVDGRNTEDPEDDTYYCVPIGTSVIGMYYNETVIDNALGKGKWELPRTSDEFLALCERLKEKDCHILIPGTLDQWTAAVYMPWWSQYEGFSNYSKFYQAIGYDKTKNRETTNSNLIFRQPGRLAAAEASADFLSYDNGYILKNSIEINVNNLNEYQTRFTLAKYNYAFYPCGDWLMQELKNNTTIQSDSVIKMMKTPVISSIIESTDSYSGSDAKRLPNITSDAMLSQVVAYVDGEGELPAGVTEEEVSFVSEARHTVGSMAENYVMYAPVSSNAKKLADEFILFMATDEGIQIYKEHCLGSFTAYTYEHTGLGATEQSVFDVNKDAVYVDDFHFHPLFYAAGVQANSAGLSGTLDGLLCKPDGLTGKELNDAIIEAYNDKIWENYLLKLQE